VRPAVISHGANAPVEEEERFRAEFDWTGTRDITPWLAVPHALRTMGEMLPGGWPEVMKRNHQLALEGRRIVADELEVPLPCPDSMVGSLATLILPESANLENDAPRAGIEVSPLQQSLWERHRIEVPILSLPGSRNRLVRMSAQLYNERSDFERLGKALRELCLR
jgi:isopenicillin-N epimerase